MNDLHAAFVMQHEEWMSQSACKGADPNLFVLDQGYTGTKAIQYCKRCEVRKECADYARRTKSIGIFGGKLFTFRTASPTELIPIQKVQDAQPYRVNTRSNRKPSILGSPIRLARPSILGR